MQQSWDLKAKTIAAFAAFGVYFALAGLAKVIYVDPVPQGKLVLKLVPPFERFGLVGAVSYEPRNHEELVAVADEAMLTSPILLYENGKLLGPAHSQAGDIGLIGRGRYLHVRQGMLFSASDNSDVNANGRTYWIVFPHPGAAKRSNQSDVVP